MFRNNGSRNVATAALAAACMLSSIPAVHPQMLRAYAQEAPAGSEIGSHATETGQPFSIDVDIKELYAAYGSMKADFDKDLEEFGTIDIFEKDGEAQDIMDSLESQDEAADLQKKLDEYRENASGWITADAESENKGTKTRYKAQKLADKGYNTYMQKYDEAVKAFRKGASKEAMAQTASEYPQTVDRYEKVLAEIAEDNRKKADGKDTDPQAAAERGDGNILKAPVISGITASAMAGNGKKAADSTDAAGR